MLLPIIHCTVQIHSYKSKAMKKIILILFLFLPVCCFFQNSASFAQEVTSLTDTSTNSETVTDLIFSVDPKNNGINEVFLKEPDVEAQLYKLKGECYRCEFYKGNITGKFAVKNSRIRPGKKTVLTIHTMENLMPGKIFDPGQFPPGSRFNLARTKTTVIDNQKGSFKVRVN